MAHTQNMPINTFLRECRTFLEEISTGQRRTRLSYGELMVVATYVREITASNMGHSQDSLVAVGSLALTGSPDQLALRNGSPDPAEAASVASQS